MSGSGGGGYEYQAQTAAYVATHILAKQPLRWIEHFTSDIPVAIAEETGGSGDDIKIELQDGTSIELQAKHGLKKDSKFWEATIKLIRGLVEDSSLYGILLTDSTASSTIRDELRKDIERLGQGREDNLKVITQEVIDKLGREGIPYSSDAFRRFQIVLVDVDNSQRDAKTALVLLSQVLDIPEQAGQAWNVLFTKGMNLITKEGRCDGASFLRLLGCENIQLSSEKAQADSVKRYQQLERAMQESKTRCIDQWEYLGVSRSDAMTFADDLSVGILPSNLELSPGKLVILTGKLGSGKSLIGERLFQSTAQKVLEGISAPIPIRFEAREIQKYRSLRHALEETSRELYIPASQNIFIIIDEVDRIGITNSSGLFREARILVQVQPNLTILLIGRPIAEFVYSQEVIEPQLLSREASEALVRQISGRQYFSFESFSHSVQDAVRLPLFAVLLGSHLRSHPVWIPQSKEQLLRSLVERYLDRVRENASKVGELLEQLASACVDQGSTAVPSSTISRWADQQQLLESWLVVQDADNLRFPLPILAQWFASQCLTSDSSLVRTLAGDRQRLELWQYPLVIAIATLLPNRVSELLIPIAEAQPALAANIVSEAIAFQDRSIEVSASSALALGQQVRDAMQAWINGFQAFAPVLPFVRNDGVLPSLGVRLSQRILESPLPSSNPTTTDWVEIAWHSTNERPPVNELPPGREDSEYLWSLGWKSIQGFLPYSQASWEWRWTLKQVIRSLLEHVSIPIEAGHLSLEAAWFGAVYITQRRRNYSYPIPLREIESILSQLEDSRFPPVIQHCLRQLRIEVEAAHLREQTHLSLPNSFIALRNDQTISYETLLNYVATVYHGAFEGYQQLVNALSPKFLPSLPLASIFPARLVGVVVPPSSSSDSVTWSYYWEPLPEGSQNELSFTRSDRPLTETDPNVQAALEKIRTIEPKWWMQFSPRPQFESPVSRYWLGINPVTKLAYQWLWDDLKRLAWVSGELDASDAAYWHPVGQVYRSGMD